MSGKAFFNKMYRQNINTFEHDIRGLYRLKGNILGLFINNTLYMDIKSTQLIRNKKHTEQKQIPVLP